MAEGREPAGKKGRKTGSRGRMKVRKAERQDGTNLGRRESRRVRRQDGRKAKCLDRNIGGRDGTVEGQKVIEAG